MEVDVERTVKKLKSVLMQSLWKLSEASTDERESKLLELAGNLIEESFSQNTLPHCINTSLQDVLGKSRLHEDLQDSIEEMDIIEWLEKSRDVATELTELGVKSAMLLADKLDQELKYFLHKKYL
jgi:hypothetical protein